MARIARSLLFRLTGLDTLESIYAALPAGPDETFADRALHALGVDVAVGAADIARIPPHGPLVLAANHPRGAVDGLALLSALRRARPDARLIANGLLARIPELRSTCFFVDPFEGPGAASRSLAGLRAAHLWLRSGGAVVLFPAGEVAPELDDDGGPEERRWTGTFARLAAATGATVVPLHLDGRNSHAFYAAGRLHSWLRTLMLPRELIRSRGSRTTVRVGFAVEPEPANTLTGRTQRAVSRLGRHGATFADEIAALPPAARLVESGRFDVFHASATDIPLTLGEIGRLRAVAFGAAGEGTGAAVDLDAFDADYVHLFLWDRDRRNIAGAYRLGRADRLVQSRGVRGLYTRTLFEYDETLVQRLSPGLELGRSFVSLEYQRDYQPLLLLWRGIGQFVVRYPHYRYLFGPVSISRRYSDASRSAMLAFLVAHHRDATLASLVTSPHPPSLASASRLTPPTNAQELDKAVASLEHDGKGVPVLLRQYLKLGAKAMAVSVDTAFSNVTDVLMAVDLESVAPAVLRRYVGEAGLSSARSRQLPPVVSPAA